MATTRQTKRLRVEMYVRARKQDGALHCVGPNRTVKEVLKELRKLTGLEALKSLWTRDGYRLYDRAEMWPLVDHDSLLVACDKDIFPAAAAAALAPAAPARKRAAAAADEGEGEGEKAAAAKKSRTEPPAAAASDGGVSPEYQHFLDTDGKTIMAQFKRENPHDDPRQGTHTTTIDRLLWLLIDWLLWLLIPARALR
jgi:hypothetical protein